MFNPRLTSGLPTSMTNTVMPSPSVAPGHAIGNPANGPVPQLLPARSATTMPVGRGAAAGMDAGGIGMPWEHTPMPGRRAF
jgi:hypothetical protein